MQKWLTKTQKQKNPDDLRDVPLKSQPSANLKSPELPEDIATDEWASAKNVYLYVRKHVNAEYEWTETAINGDTPQTQQN